MCKGTAFLAVFQYLFALFRFGFGHRNDGVRFDCLLGGRHIALYLRADYPLDCLHRVAWLGRFVKFDNRLHDSR